MRTRPEEAVNAEASALRSVVLLSDDLPAEAQTRMRALVRRHIEEAVSDEWPAMESQRAHLRTVPAPLADALHLAPGIAPQGEAR